MELLEPYFYWTGLILWFLSGLLGFSLLTLRIFHEVLKRTDDLSIIVTYCLDRKNFKEYLRLNKELKDSSK